MSLSRDRHPTKTCCSSCSYHQAFGPLQSPHYPDDNPLLLLPTGTNEPSEARQDTGKSVFEQGAGTVRLAEHGLCTWPSQAPLHRGGAPTLPPWLPLCTMPHTLHIGDCFYLWKPQDLHRQLVLPPVKVSGPYLPLLSYRSLSSDRNASTGVSEGSVSTLYSLITFSFPFALFELS